MFPGSTEVEVFRPGNHKPHFVIVGASMKNLDGKKVAEYMYGCDWTDRGSKGWITPWVRCDDFLKTDAITHGGPDRGYKLCRCSDCGVEAVCTPMCDFYTLPGNDTGPLLCETCVLKPEERNLN